MWHIITINSNTNDQFLKAIYSTVMHCRDMHTHTDMQHISGVYQVADATLAAWVQLAVVPLTAWAGSLTVLQLKDNALMYTL